MRSRHRFVDIFSDPVGYVNSEADRAAEDRLTGLGVVRIDIACAVGEIEGIYVGLTGLPISVDRNCGPLAVGIRGEGVDCHAGSGSSDFKLDGEIGALGCICGVVLPLPSC